MHEQAGTSRVEEPREMSGAIDPPSLDIREQIMRIDRAIAETQEFQAEISRMTIEAGKLSAETRKLDAEGRKLGRDARLSSLVVAVTFVSAVGGLVTGILSLLRASGRG